MPELPDITTYIHALKKRTLDQSVRSLKLNSPFLLRTAVPSITELTEQRNARIADIQRMGKRIVFVLPSERFLVLHLMIAGRLHWYPSGRKIPAKSSLMIMSFNSGTLTLTEAGSKKRASLHYLEGIAAKEQLDPRGLEILDASLDVFSERLTRKNHTLKRALTSPRIFSGIGNAYSDEILHAARLSPVKQSSKLSADEISRLYTTIRTILSESTEKLLQEAGDEFPKKVTAFRQDMAVHGKYRNPCPVCETAIQRIRYVGNETNYCPRCQTDGKLLADRALSRLLKSDWPKTIEELENQRADDDKKS